MPIRRATTADIDAIRRVAERSWAVDYPDILSRETAATAVDDWYRPGQLHDELDAERTVLFVTDRAESVVGFAHATWSDETDEGYILRIYVHPEHRRQDVGQGLLERTCTDLFDRGVDRIYAMVLSENDPGNVFYRRFGFEHVDERETTIAGDHYQENRYELADRSQLRVE